MPNGKLKTRAMSLGSSSSWRTKNRQPNIKTWERRRKRERSDGRFIMKAGRWIEVGGLLVAVYHYLWRVSIVQEPATSQRLSENLWLHSLVYPLPMNTPVAAVTIPIEGVNEADGRLTIATWVKLWTHTLLQNLEMESDTRSEKPSWRSTSRPWSPRPRWFHSQQ